MLATIAKRLRTGIKPDQHGSALEPRAGIAWITLLLSLLAGLALCLAAGVTFDADLVRAAPVLPFWLALSAILVRRVGHPTLGGFLEAFALTHGLGVLMIFLSFGVAVLSFPFADQTLAGWDAALGLDVRPLILSVRDDPTGTYVLGLVYRSFLFQPTLILAMLFITDRTLMAWRFVTAWTLSMAAAYIGLFFAPAVDSYRHFGFTPEEFPHLTNRTPWHTAEVLTSIKAEGLRHMSAGMLDGFVTIPSFHAVAAVLLTWAAWPNRILRWPILALNLAMLPATIVIGAHYFVDLLAGMAVATLAVLTARRLVR